MVVAGIIIMVANKSHKGTRWKFLDRNKQTRMEEKRQGSLDEKVPSITSW